MRHHTSRTDRLPVLAIRCTWYSGSRAGWRRSPWANSELMRVWQNHYRWLPAGWLPRTVTCFWWGHVCTSDLSKTRTDRHMSLGTLPKDRFRRLRKLRGKYGFPASPKRSVVGGWGFRRRRMRFGWGRFEADHQLSGSKRVVGERLTRKIRILHLPRHRPIPGTYCGWKGNR